MTRIRWEPGTSNSSRPRKEVRPAGESLLRLRSLGDGWQALRVRKAWRPVTPAGVVLDHVELPSIEACKAWMQRQHGPSPFSAASALHRAGAVSPFEDQ